MAERVSHEEKLRQEYLLREKANEMTELTKN